MTEEYGAHHDGESAAFFEKEPGPPPMPVFMVMCATDIDSVWDVAQAAGDRASILNETQADDNLYAVIVAELNTIPEELR